MKFFVKASSAPEPKSRQSTQIAIVLAGVFALMATMQLFTFEEFVPLADSFALPGFSGVGFATTIIVFEVMSLPFLLRMALSPAFRYLSAGFAGLASALWLYASLIIVLGGSSVLSIGFSGGLGELTPGWWAVFVSLLFVIMSVWSIWGLGLTSLSFRRK